MPNTYILSSSGELYHYGVKGMKWGIRRYQDKSGRLTPEGKKRRSKESPVDRDEIVKRLARRDLDADRKMTKAREEYDAQVQKLQKTLKEPEKWWGEDRRLTKEASDYHKAFEKAYEDWFEKDKALREERRAEEAKLFKSVLTTEDVKPSLDKARDLRKGLNTLFDDMVGFKSKAYQDAWQDYKSKNGEDEYGFDHYYWPRSAERKRAVADYERKASAMEREYDDLVTNIGKTITNGFGNQKISDDSWYKNYEEWGRREVDEIIYFNRIGL